MINFYLHQECVYPLKALDIYMTKGDTKTSLTDIWSRASPILGTYHCKNAKEQGTSQWASGG